MSFRLPRLPEDAEIVTANRRPSFRFQRWWQSIVTKLEGQENTQDDLLVQLQQAQADIVTALNQAGIALDLAGAIMPDIPPVTILADYTGTVLDGQLPRDIQAQRFSGDDDVTADADWSATTLSGGVTYTMGTGVLNLTAITSSAVVEITSEYNGIPRSRKLPITLQLQDPPPSSGATTEYDSSIDPTSSTSYGSANAGPLTLTCGASGEVQLSAPLVSLVSEFSASAGTYGCAGKWQVSAAGAGTWSDVDTEVTEDLKSVVFDTFTREHGSIRVNMTATGLTPASDYDFQLLLRNTDTADQITYYGTATATTT